MSQINTSKKPIIGTTLLKPLDTKICRKVAKVTSDKRDKKMSNGITSQLNKSVSKKANKCIIKNKLFKSSFVQM